MALLSADDVLNKRFQPTKFREGYDQDEVDDFLDEVVNTLRAVYAENEELKAQLEACEDRVAELSSGGVVVAPPQPAPAAPVEEVAQEQIQMPVPQLAGQGPAAPGDAAGMLALAQRLHDEYVTNGREEADRLIQDARAEGDRMIREAKGIRAQTLKQLENERGVLERKIDDLRTFEREYRARMRSYLEGLLESFEQVEASGQEA